MNAVFLQRLLGDLPMAGGDQPCELPHSPEYHVRQCEHGTVDMMQSQGWQSLQTLRGHDYVTTHRRFVAQTHPKGVSFVTRKSGGDPFFGEEETIEIEYPVKDPLVVKTLDEIQTDKKLLFTSPVVLLDSPQTVPSPLTFQRLAPLTSHIVAVSALAVLKCVQEFRDATPESRVALQPLIKYLFVDTPGTTRPPGRTEAILAFLHGIHATVVAEKKAAPPFQSPLDERYVWATGLNTLEGDALTMDMQSDFIKLWDSLRGKVLNTTEDYSMSDFAAELSDPVEFVKSGYFTKGPKGDTRKQRFEAFVGGLKRGWRITKSDIESVD
jgi:hypothetical protein